MLTNNQIKSIKLLLDGDQDTDPVKKGINDHVNTLIESREDMLAVLRIHNEFSDNVELAASVRSAKNRAKDAANALVTLLA